MDGFKIDPEKYAGLSREEAERRMEADERRAIMEDPRTVAAFRAMDEREAAREAEVAAEWEKEKESRRHQWVDAGGGEEEFEEAWPELKKGILMERVFAAEIEREARSVDVKESIWGA